MNVTRDVITDLLPLFHSGESSEDTRKLVEGFLAHDPEFAELVRESAEVSLTTDVPAPAKEIELETLQKTKGLLRLRGATFWVALFLSFTPLTVYNTSWGSGWVLFDHPGLAAALAAVALAFWVAHITLRRRLGTIGL